MPRENRSLKMVLTAIVASLVGQSAFATSLKCSSVFASRSSAKLSEHFIRSGQDEFLPLMNSISLVNYVSNGGRPKAGIASYWSSASVLKEILSLRGPLGSRGPLGRSFGVFGQGPSYPSYWIKQYFDLARQNPVMKMWLNFASQFGPVRGPLSPLKQFGPMFGDWNEGAYNILGTPGFLGALTLGPAGPVGALQTAGIRGPDANGQYHDIKSGRVVDSLKLRVGNEEREYRIFKFLKPDFAVEQSKAWNLDTAFAVDDQLPPGDRQKTYQLTNSHEQMISFLVVPDAISDRDGRPVNFSIEVRDGKGKLLLESHESDLANFVQIKASKGAKLSVEVTGQNRDLSVSRHYRLLVVGDPYFDLEKEGALDSPQAMPMP